MSIDIVFFFFKQKTAYEMRSSDWSSDVCSSDLISMINFRSIHAHGFIRVGACTPIATVGCPHTNMKLTEDLANQAAREYADLLVFPELNISSYSIDDLHLQDTIIKSRSEEHTSELQSLIRTSYAVFCLKK